MQAERRLSHRDSYRDTGTASEAKFVFFSSAPTAAVESESGAAAKQVVAMQLPRKDTELEGMEGAAAIEELFILEVTQNCYLKFSILDLPNRTVQELFQE